MRPSHRGSGEIESDELAYGRPRRADIGDVGDILDCACISSSSVTSLGGITDERPDFRFEAAFWIGDWATLRLPPLRVLVDCLRVRRGCFCCWFAASPRRSISKSTGDAVEAVLAVVC
jgi:hypothetical protein